MPQSYYFNNGFNGEDSCEGHVEDLENKRHFLGLLVVLYCHGDHVHDDEEEDKYFEPVENINEDIKDKLNEHLQKQ